MSVLSLVVSFQGSKGEEESIVKARSWCSSVDPGLAKVGASFYGKKFGS